MKLAEALLLRSEYQQVIESLRGRALANIKVQEGEHPNEDPKALKEEAFQLEEKLADLIKKTNTRNISTKLADGRSLMEALVDREEIMKKRNFLSQIAGKATEQDYRLTRAEIKIGTSIPVRELQEEIDKLSKEFRLLDTEIQGINWTTDL